MQDVKHRAGQCPNVCLVCPDILGKLVLQNVAVFGFGMEMVLHFGH